MRQIVALFFILISILLAGTLYSQNKITQDIKFEVSELNNSIFKQDKYWRGADGAATIDLENGKILWLFSDSFVNPKGNGKRPGSVMINNTLAIQEGNDLQNSEFRFYWKGSNKKPEAFFEVPGETWFWTGHGTIADGKLLIFLFEEKSTTEGLGFESVGWTLAMISNPNDDPEKWEIRYVKGPMTFGVIVGSSAVLKDEDFVYAFGVKEPGTHETFLLRSEIKKISNGDLSGMEWWTGNKWESNLKELPKPAVLFEGQTEFSVHYDNSINKYVQIQTFGFGHSSLGFRLADKLEGPWSEPVIFYTPKLQEGEFNYTANAHPELKSDGILITYNVNNFDFGKLTKNENIYYPRLIKLKFTK